MTSRTWGERFDWMDRYCWGARLQYVKGVGFVCYYHGGIGNMIQQTPEEAVDKAMEERTHVQGEREAAERAKKDCIYCRLTGYCKSASGDTVPCPMGPHTASRSPLAALLDSDVHGYNQFGLYETVVRASDLRAAIKAQAALWRKEANGCYDEERQAAYRRCANELEGT